MSEPASGLPTAQRILFVHIPKTAGISLERALRQWAGDTAAIRFQFGGQADADVFRRLPAERIEQLRLISGHLSYRTFRHRLDDRWQAITILRHPLERFLSLYSFVRGTPNHPWHDEVSELSPAEFFDWQGADPTEANRQCRMVGGQPDADVAWETLNQRFLLASSVLHLPEMTAALSLAVGCELVVPHANRTHGKIDLSELPREVVAMVEARDAADSALYRRVNSAGLVGTAIAE